MRSRHPSPLQYVISLLLMFISDWFHRDRNLRKVLVRTGTDDIIAVVLTILFELYRLQTPVAWPFLEVEFLTILIQYSVLHIYLLFM